MGTGDRALFCMTSTDPRRPRTYLLSGGVGARPSFWGHPSPRLLTGSPESLGESPMYRGSSDLGSLMKRGEVVGL